MHQRGWDGKEWEKFAKKLVQLRHGPTNVQSIPDSVNGDCGVEYYTMGGCLYQSFAPREAVDVAKSSKAQKRKVTSDLKKLIKYKDTISKLLGTVKIDRWILLCPFVDNKDVVRFIQTQVDKLNILDLDFVAPTFHGLIHSQDDFSSELEKLKLESIGIPLKIAPPTDEEISLKGNLIDDRLQTKLKKAFPDEGADQINRRKLLHVKAWLKRQTTLAQLRDSFPDLWEISENSINSEEDLLGMVGLTGAPQDQLQKSLVRVEQQLKTHLPSLGNPTIQAISQGTLSDWLIRCPLDFV